MATIVEPEIIRRQVQPHGEAVRRELAGVRRRLRRHLLWEGLAWTVGVAALLVAVSFAADRLLRLGTGTRLALLPIGIAAVLAVVYVKLLRPLRLRLDDLDLAVLLDRRLPGYGERVANVLQLPALLQRDPSASPSMISASVLQQADELRRIDVRAKFNQDRLRALTLAIVLPVVVLAAAALVWPGTARLWARRWLLGSAERWPQHTYLSIVGLGDSDRLYVPRGESIVLEVTAQPPFARDAAKWVLTGRGEPLSVAGEEAPASAVPGEVRIRYRQGGSPKVGTLTHFTDDRFRYELPSVEEPVNFWISGGDDWLGPIAVVPLDRPGIEQLTIVSQAPGREETETHGFSTQESQLLFLPGTKLELSLTSDVPLESARLLATSGTAPQFERRDERRYAAQWLMADAQTLQIKLVDAQAHLASTPYYISLNLLQDRIPRVTIRSSGVGRRITPQAMVPLALRAIDDFGLTSVKIDVEQMALKDDKPETNTHEVPVPLAPPAAGQPLTEMETEQPLKLKEYVLTAGNTLKVRGAAADNRAEGSQVGQSRWLTFQIVTPEELFYEILMMQRAQREKFRATLEVEKSQATSLETLAEKEQLSTITRKHQVAARQVSQIANRLEATLQEMTLNELGSSQARELLSSGIIAPMREMHDSAMTRLRSLLDQMTVEPGRMSELSRTALEAQQEIVEQMTRILERMAQWESFVDVLNQVRQIMQLQNQVLEATQKTRTERTNSLFDD